MARPGDVEGRPRLPADAIAHIELETRVEAPPERCFDLSLSVDVHLESTRHTEERVLSGPPSGLLALGDVITWEARHFGRRWRLTMTVSEEARPGHFRDEQVRGPFRRLVHDHRFEADGDGTIMRDDFEVVFFPLVDRFVLVPHLRRLLLRRNALIRRLAEAA